MKRRDDPRYSFVSRPFSQPTSIEDMVKNHKSSSHGWHATGAPATCPEKARLKMLGVKFKYDNGYGFEGNLDARSLGSLWHLMLEAECRDIDPIKMLASIDGVPHTDFEKLETMYLLYRQAKSHDAWSLVGAEVKIQVPLPGVRRLWEYDADQDRVVQRRPYFTARLDKLVVIAGRLHIVEHKTAAAMRAGTLKSWRVDPQIISQAWALMQHPASAKYGGYYSHIMDIITKTIEPEVVREPLQVRRRQMKLFETSYIEMRKEKSQLLRKYGPHKSWPRALQCYGRYGGCEYIDLCHEDARFNYLNLRD